MILVLLEHQTNPILNGKNTFLRIRYLLGFMQTLELMMKSIVFYYKIIIDDFVNKKIFLIK